MQIIQSIRDKGAAIVIGVIALSLIGFLLMDARGNGKGIFGGGSRSTTVAKVNGDAIESAEYEKVIKQLELQQGGTPTPEQTNQIRSAAWDQLIAEKLITDDAAKIGLAFNPNEITRIIFSPEDAPQALRQAYTDQTTGEYKVQDVQEWWKRVKKLKDNVEKEKAEKDMVQAQLIDPLKLQVLYTKYNAYFKAATYYPTWMKDKDSAEAVNFATITYTSVPFSVINDSTITVTDKEIEAYIEKNKLKFKQESGRMISYYSFSSNPNTNDTIAAKTAVEALKPAFAADSNAKVYVSRNSSTLPYSPIFVPKKDMKMPMADSIMALAKNQVFGPYMDHSADNKKASFVLAKMLEIKTLPDSIKCRHILVGTMDPQTQQPTTPDSIAKARIDSVEKLIQAGVSFDSLEARYSTDQVAHKDKGVMTFDIKTIQGDGFAKEFAEFLMNEKGETKKVVKTSFGYHYIEILEKKNPAPAYNVAYMAKEVVASDETVNAASQQAVKLAGTYRDAKSLDAYAAKNGIKKIVLPTPAKESDFTLMGLADGRKVIRWAFGAKEGEVSDPIIVGDQNIVAEVDKIIKEGAPDVATARPLVEKQLKQQKIAEEIIKKLGANPTVESAATAYPGLMVQTAGADSSITYGAQIIQNVGQEPKIIGACFNKDNLGKTLKPITGASAVYIVRVDAVKPKDPAAVTTSLAQQVQTRMGSLANQFANWYTALRKQAKIKDYRISDFGY